MFGVYALATRTVRFRLFPSLPLPSAVPTNMRQADYYYLLANNGLSVHAVYCIALLWPARAAAGSCAACVKRDAIL